MGKRVGGVLGLWSDDHKCVEAAHKVRKAGYKKFDAITPFPVHGMEEAVGIDRSFIPYVTFIFGVTGCSLGVLFEWWTSAVSWALNIGGKPFFSLPAFIPVAFECTILFGALSTVATLFIVTGIPNRRRVTVPPELTDCKFALFIPENDVGFSREKAEKILRENGAEDVRILAEF